MVNNILFTHLARKLEPLRFAILFTATSVLLYSFNLAFIGCTTKGGPYIAWLDNHLNYIRLWRSFTIRTTSDILELLGYTVFQGNTWLKVYDHGGFQLLYSCLGYGIMSVYTAFVISYPAIYRQKAKFLLTGLILIQCLNLLRFVALALFWKDRELWFLDHHLLFNALVYAILLARIHRWTNKQIHNKNIGSYAAHPIT